MSKMKCKHSDLSFVAELTNYTRHEKDTLRTYAVYKCDKCGEQFKAIKHEGKIFMLLEVHLNA